MKKVFSFVAVSLALALSASFISCKAPSGGGKDPRQEVSGKIGKYEKPYEVGDILFTDGSATAYKSGLTLTAEQKSKAIAVIYKVNGSKAYGVGLVHNRSGLAWCLYEAKGMDKYFSDIQCTPYQNAVWTFTGDTDGSDNFTKISEALGEDDDTGTPGNYPAFEFAKNYKNQANSHVSGTDYEDDWYLPSVAELYDIWTKKATVDAASALCGGSQFGNENIYYWSSSQFPSPSDPSWALPLCFYDPSYYYDYTKNRSEYFVCCIRVF